MMSSPKTASPAAPVGNVTAEKISHNARGVPLPYFSGRHELPLILGQSRVYNRVDNPVKSKVGKGSKTTGYEYFGDVFGLVSCCLNDYLAEIKIGGVIVWQGDIERDEAHPHHTGDIVISGVGTFRYYWGTSTQPLDDLVLATCGEDHPHYPDQSYLVGKRVAFGSSNVPPVITVVAERAARFPGLDESRSREGANAVTTLAEVIGNDWFGLGRPDLIHVDTWAPFAAAQVRERAMPLEGAPDHVAKMGFISPFLDRRQAASAFFGGILENFDGFLRPLGDKLGIGQFPHDGVIPEDLPVLSYHDFTRPPKFAANEDSDGAVISDALVSFTNRANAMQKETMPGENLAARDRLGGVREKSFARPFVITDYQAREQADELAKFYSRPERACDAAGRRERFTGLRAGSRFVLNDTPGETSLVVRIVSRTDPARGGEATFSLVAERGLAPLAHTAAATPSPTLPDPELVPIEHARIFQLPAKFFATPDPAPAIVPLAVRPGAHVAGFDLHLSTDDATYDELARVNRWALRGNLDTAIDADDASFTINAGGHDLAILAEQSDQAQADDTLLLVCGYEVMSIGAVTALGGGQYSVAVLRGRRGTYAAVHADAAEVYLIAREDLAIFQHAVFPRTTSTRYFKLPAVTGSGETQELADALALTFVFDDRDVADPTDFSAVGKAEAIFVSFKLPRLADGTPDPTIAMAEIFEVAHGAGAPTGGALNTPTIEQLGGAINRGGLTAGTQKDYYIRLRDTIGNHSALLGPETAIALAAPTGLPGDDGDSVFIEYSVDGATSWHSTFTTGDLYMRQKIGAAGTWSAAILIVGTPGAPGAAGTRGSKSFNAATTGTTWSDSEADTAIGAAGFAKVTIDSVTLHNEAAGYAETRFWTGSAWLVVTQVIDGNLVVHGTIGTDHLIAGISITTPTILGGVLKLNGASTVCANTAEGSDNSIVRLNGGGADGQGRGGQIDVLGNEYITVTGLGGSVLITPGNHADASLRLRDRTGTDRIQITSAGLVKFTGNPSLSPAAAYNTIDFNTQNFIGVNDISCYDIDCTSITTNDSNVNAGTGIVMASEFRAGGTKVIGSQGAAVGNADTTTVATNLGVGGGPFATVFDGSDTINKAALYSYLNALGGAFNGNAALQNALRDRLKASGGHGLIA